MPVSPLFRLSKLYHPVQPRCKDGGEAVSYREVDPDPLLSGLIYCYWQLQSTKPLSNDFQYNVVADGCIDLFFDLNNPHESYVMGFASEYSTFSLTKHFNYAGIRFFPGAFPSLYNIEASALRNQCQNIEVVIPHANKTLKNLLVSQYGLERLKPGFDSYFKKIVISKNISIDSRFVESLSDILGSAGALKIEKDISTCISKRHLRRLFDFYIGAPPKEFNKVVRFQKFLGHSKTRHCLKNEKVYYDMGYYDQSHFIKDFKVLYGATPLKAFTGSATL